MGDLRAEEIFDALVGSSRKNFELVSAVQFRPSFAGLSIVEPQSRAMLSIREDSEFPEMRRVWWNNKERNRRVMAFLILLGE